MKVLRHGWKYYEDNDDNVMCCDCCKCEFQYDKNDVVRENGTFPFFDGRCWRSVKTYNDFINCPECNMKIQVGAVGIESGIDYFHNFS